MTARERAFGPRARRHPSEGFTLVEIVIVLALSAMIGASVVALLQRQHRFYDVNDDAIHAGRSVRATADLFGRELRPASASDLVVATSDSLVFRADLHRGVVCRVEGETVTSYVYASPPANVSGPHGTAVTRPRDSVAAHDPDFDAYGSTASALERDACREAGSPTGGSWTSYRTVDWSPSALPVPERGTWLRIVAPLTYRVAPSRFSVGLAVWREGQELAAPFRTAGFRYGLADGSRVSSVPPADLASVRRVRIELVAAGSASPRPEADRPFSYDVFLRN